MKKCNNSFKLVALSALFVTVSAISADFCVTNTAELNQALLSAAVNNQDDLIKIAEGLYFVETTGFFGSGFQYLGENENFNLEISGGWSAFFGNPCGQQFNNPSSTILDGHDERRVLNIETGTADVTISNLFITGGRFIATGLFVAGGGLKVLLKSTSTVKIERVIFTFNYAAQAGALTISTVNGGGRAYLKNNLIAFNSSDNKDFVADLSVSENYAINNTIMFNFGSGIISLLPAGLGYKAFFANNILWGNDVFDYFIFGSADAEVYLYNNNLGVQAGNLPVNTVEFGNISQAPELELGTIDFVFTPVSGSPLINAGKSAPIVVPVPPQFEFSWHYGLLDIEGADRVKNGRVDIGAFEAALSSLPDLVFANSFE